MDRGTHRPSFGGEDAPSPEVTMYRCFRALFGWLPLLLALGCTPIQVWMGWRVRLEKTPITTLSATLPGGALAPGEKASLVVTVVQPDGTPLHTEGSPGGKVLWEDLQLNGSGVEVGPKGRVSLPADPRLSDGRSLQVTVTVPSHPDLRAELAIPITYARPFRADFSGRPGHSGMDGLSGSDGMSGSMGSIDLNNPSPGGNGTDGGRGSDGDNGGPGGDAPSVLVNVALRPGPHPLLQVTARGGERVERFLVDPEGGTLSISAEGGPGGSGGRGGRGGHGGMGGSGSPSGSSGSDGASGSDGWSGAPGQPGRITVVYDASAKPFLAALRFPNRSGARRSGPAPEFLEAEVGPLW